MSQNRLLLIDDNWTRRLMVENHIRHQKRCEVEATDEPQTGLERAALGQYDVIVTSLMLDGYPPKRLLKKLDEIRPAPLLVAIAPQKLLDTLPEEYVSLIWKALPLPLTRTAISGVVDDSFEHLQTKACSTLISPSPSTREGDAGEVAKRRRKSATGGAKLGRFELRERLGSGRAGTVYRGLVPANGRTVAVRVMPRRLLERLGGGRRWRDWFHREANVSSSVEHPNLAAVLDHGLTEDERCLYLVSQFADGRTLREKLGDDHLSVAESIKMARHIAAALAAIHGVGFAHRLVRPTNIVIGAEGEAMLTDLGVAGILAWDLLPLRERLDTMPYLSPEQVRFGHVDDRSDQFSLGLVLHEALTGRSAFGGESPSKRIRAIVDEVPEISLEEVSHARKELEKLLSMMLARNPEERFQGDIELQAAIEACGNAAQSSAS